MATTFSSSSAEDRFDASGIARHVAADLESIFGNDRHAGAESRTAASPTLNTVPASRTGSRRALTALAGVGALGVGERNLVGRILDLLDHQHVAGELQLAGLGMDLGVHVGFGAVAGARRLGDDEVQLDVAGEGFAGACRAASESASDCDACCW